MDKEVYVEIIQLYKREKNIKRLVYRLIKAQYETDKRKKTNWLSKRDIIYIAEKIIHSKDEIEMEKDRIHKEKLNFLNKKSNILLNNGCTDIEILNDFSIRYKDKDRDYHDVVAFPVEINEIDSSYLKDTKNRIIDAIEYLSSIGYIQDCNVKNTHPKVKKGANIGTTKRYKSLK